MKYIMLGKSLIIMILAFGCSSVPKLVENQSGQSKYIKSQLVLSLILLDVQPSGGVPLLFSGTPWIVVIMNDGSFRDGGFILSDDELKECIKGMHGQMAIVVRVGDPGQITTKATASAVSRMMRIIKDNAPEDLQASVYLYVQYGDKLQPK